jgi:tripartite-type tricarboxylate transporter receptor subunit TctC
MIARHSLFAAVAMLAFVAGPAQAQDAAAFYKGKNITFITPGSPGGGYDTYMREIIPHLEKKTGATVVPINEPGGGHLLAVNKTYSAKPDGLTILLNDGEASLLGVVLDVPGARYDLSKMNWISRINAEKRLILFTKSSPYKTIKEAVGGKTVIKFGTTGKTDATGLATTMASYALGLNTSVVTGYKGSREFVRAAVQGEVGAISLSESSALRFSKGGRLIPAATLAHERSALFPKVPTVFEQLKISKDKAWYLDFHESFAEIGRSLLTGPGVPADRVAFLRKVFEEILNDKAFVAHMEQKKRPILYANAATLEKAAKAVLDGLTAERKKELKDIILNKYYK